MPTAMQNLTQMLATIDVAELRSRQNALPDFLLLVREAFAEIDGKVVASIEQLGRIQHGVSEETSPEMASLAAKFLSYKRATIDEVAGRSDEENLAVINDLLEKGKRLAGSALTQTPDQDTLPLPLDDVAARALRDAQNTGQAQPLTRTVEVGPDSTGKQTDVS
jgi:hypothetical protein